MRIDYKQMIARVYSYARKGMYSFFIYTNDGKFSIKPC